MPAFAGRRRSQRRCVLWHPLRPEDVRRLRLRASGFQSLANHPLHLAFLFGPQGRWRLRPPAGSFKARYSLVPRPRDVWRFLPPSSEWISIPRPLNPLPVQAGICPFEARGFRPVSSSPVANRFLRPCRIAVWPITDLRIEIILLPELKMMIACLAVAACLMRTMTIPIPCVSITI